MPRINKIIALAALAGAMSFGSTQAAAPAFDPKDAIEYRERIMRTLQEQTAIIGMMASMAVPDSHIKETATTIALAAKMAAKSFEQNAPGGEAKPEVWTKYADFKSKMDAFVVDSQKLADAANKGATLGELTELLVPALPCKDCHDLYRDEKKK
jgi:cytochrome c556